MSDRASFLVPALNTLSILGVNFSLRGNINMSIAGLNQWIVSGNLDLLTLSSLPLRFSSYLFIF
ncbi:MAG: hypothetical protein KME18_13310 [Phormidium tanganyikae FI6-MK23]|nr:hypothetical protein [Phormidium tanganyikae FI6-MK23]